MPILKPIRAIQLNKSHPLARSLVGCWLFNEGSGGKVFDLSGYGNIGTLYGDTHFVPGKFGSVLDFDGTGDYVDCGNNDSLNVDYITISLRFKVDTFTDNAGLIAKGDNINRQYWIWIRADGSIKLEIDKGGVHSDVVTGLIVGTWYNLVVTYDGSYIRPYLNGVAQTLISQSTGTILTDDDSLKIGRIAYSEGSDYFDGQIDCLMILNRALSASEIQLLYREPFCMFDIATKLGLLYPAGQIVWLAAVSTATSSAYGLLIKHSKLAGIIDTVATLSATLTWHYHGPVERQWLVEALFDGMTANAFKLGTVLTGGWFWMRRSGCSALYRGPNMEQIDFTNILAVAEQDAGSISPPDYIPHHNHSTHFYVVRRFNICGYQECTLAAAVKVVIDANGNLIEQKPNNIFAWRLNQVYGNKIQLIWFYCPLEQESKPESFRIYYDGGTGHIDYENPIATVNYQGRKFYTYQSDALAAGRCLFAVRAKDATGIENNSLAQLGFQLSTKSPDAINILSAEAV